MKTVIKTCIFLGLLTFLQGCYKDKGNYNLIDYNGISITTVSALTVISGDTLHLIPIITWKYPDRDTTAFTYEWREADSVISTERNLAYVPRRVGRIQYFLYVTETATNIVSRFNRQVTVNSPYKAGWLMLADKDGESDLHYIRPDRWTDENGVSRRGYTLHRNFYSQLFPESPLGYGPKSINTEAFTSNTEDEVVVIQEDESVFLNGSDMSKVLLLREEFPGGAYPRGLKPKQYADGASANFMLMENGEVYWKRNTNGSTGIHEGHFMDVPIYFEGGGASISQFINNHISKSSFVYMYDEARNRFSSIYTTNGQNNWIGARMNFLNTSALPPGFVDLTDMSGHKLIYSSDYSNGTYYMNIIKNESTGDYLYQTYRPLSRTTILEFSEHQQEVFAANNTVSDNTVYYRTFMTSYLFFGEGSRLYFYDVNTRRVKLYHDFANGTITHIVADADDGELGVVLNNGNFYICSLNNATLGADNPGDSGILYQVGGLGNIADLKWKWGERTDYTNRRYPLN